MIDATAVAHARMSSLLDDFSCRPSGDANGADRESALAPKAAKRGAAATVSKRPTGGRQRCHSI
jgi:hypothetical protein